MVCAMETQGRFSDLILYFQVTKVGDRGNETLVMVPEGGGPPEEASSLHHSSEVSLTFHLGRSAI